MKVAYPRLSRSVAEQELQRVADAHGSGGLSAVHELVRFDHDQKVPVATGQIASAEEIAHVRERVMPDVQAWITSGLAGTASAKHVAAFDNSLGNALHRELNIVSSDTAHEGTWSFLTLVVFPDVAVHRFPALHQDRFIGTNRNALRRTWQRQDVLGSLLQDDPDPLGEDELVGLFERTALVRNRALARLVVRAVHGYDGPNRSAWARKFYKAVTFQTGPRMLDILDTQALAALVDQMASEASQLSDDAPD